MATTTSTSSVERARELMRRSRREHFAVGAFNVDNQETLLAIVRAAKAKQSPVPVPKRLDLELLQRIREAVDCNISLHGGSGTPGHYFREAARIGVSKINVNSDLRYAYRTTLEAQLKANPDQYAVVKIIGPVIDAVEQVVEDRIDLFGSAGHARP